MGWQVYGNGMKLEGKPHYDTGVVKLLIERLRNNEILEPVRFLCKRQSIIIRTEPILLHSNSTARYNHILSD